MIRASILVLTMGRYELTKQTLENNLKNAGAEFELLICNQGIPQETDPEDSKLDEYLRSLNPFYYRHNSYNEGIARSLNQLILRARTNYLFFQPNDILLSDNWLKIMLEHAEDLPYSGVIGASGQDLILPEQTVTGTSGKQYKINCEHKQVLDGCQVFGATMYTRTSIFNVGYFCEDYHPYGFEDSDYNFRVQLAGLWNYYIPSITATHIGKEEPSNLTEYKKKKEKYLFDNAGLHRWRMLNYPKIGLYIPPPIMKEDLD